MLMCAYVCLRVLIIQWRHHRYLYPSPQATRKRKNPLWARRIKVIEGRFGAGVASYFTFIRLVLEINVVLMLVTMFFVVIPFVSATQQQQCNALPVYSISSSFFRRRRRRRRFVLVVVFFLSYIYVHVGFFSLSLSLFFEFVKLAYSTLRIVNKGDAPYKRCASDPIRPAVQCKQHVPMVQRYVIMDESSLPHRHLVKARTQRWVPRLSCRFDSPRSE